MTHAHAGRAGGRDHRFGRAFAIGIVLNSGYVVAEAAFGVMSGSLARLADAGHNLSDVLGLAIAWGALWLVRKPASGRRTYGFKRAPVLASLMNALLLVVAVGAIGWEAIRRLLTATPSLESSTILWVAAAGLVVNGATALLLAEGRKGDLNIRGAFLHMAADTGVTVGVIAAALLMAWTGWTWIDPVISLAIATVILASTWSLLTESLDLVLEAAPRDIHPAEVRRFLLGLEGVQDLHDLHVWALSTDETAMTVHLVCKAMTCGQDLVAKLPGLVKERFSISHTTVQIETPETIATCPLLSRETI